MTGASVFGDIGLENRMVRALLAGTRAIAVLTVEDERALALAEAIAQRLDRPLHTWSVASGVDRGGRERELGSLLARLSSSDDDELWLLFEAGRELRGSAQRRMLRELAQSQRGPTLLLVETEHDAIPDVPELEVVRLRVPDREQLREHVRWIAGEIAPERPILAEALERASEGIAAAGRGLTLERFDRVIAEAVLGDHATPALVVAALERRRVDEACARVLEPVEAAPPDSLIGFVRYLEWLRARVSSRDRLRGVGLVGAPGCGRRLAARVGAGVLELPLVRTHPTVAGDPDALRSMLGALERAAPVALLVDDGDHPHVIDTLARWHSTRESGVFVFALGMRPEQLPLAWRSGGLDALFFADLPNPERRAELLAKLLPAASGDPSLLEVARAATGCSAGDLAEALTHARLGSPARARTPSAAELEAALTERPPLATREAELLEALRAWARLHALAADR